MIAEPPKPKPPEKPAEPPPPKRRYMSAAELERRLRSQLRTEKPKG